MSRSHQTYQSQVPTYLIYLSRFSRPNMSQVCMDNKGTTPGPSLPIVKGWWVMRGTRSGSGRLILLPTSLPGPTIALIKVDMLLKVDKVLKLLLVRSTLDVC